MSTLPRSYRLHSASDPSPPMNGKDHHSPSNPELSSMTSHNNTPSSRLWNRLHDIPRDPTDQECITELVIVAFGAFERYYICWKNQKEQYRQDSYGLPEDLQQWLFPANGSTRDFQTLQIVFGYGDEYFASDKDGKVSNMEANLDLRDKASAGRQQSTAGGRRKQHTLSLTDLPSNGDIGCPPSSPTAPTPTGGLLSRTRSLQRRRNTLRPLSMIAPNAGPGGNSWSVLDHRTTTYDQQQQLRPASLSVSETPSAHVGDNISKYVDAAVQTEFASNTTIIPTPLPPHSPPSSIRSGIEAPSVPVFPHPRYSFTLDRHPSIYPYHPPHRPPSPPTNPVIMGKMQRYFRAEQYRLGDALRRSCDLLH